MYYMYDEPDCRGGGDRSDGRDWSRTRRDRRGRIARRMARHIARAGRAIARAMYDGDGRDRSRLDDLGLESVVVGQLGVLGLDLLDLVLESGYGLLELNGRLGFWLQIGEFGLGFTKSGLEEVRKFK